MYNFENFFLPYLIDNGYLCIMVECRTPEELNSYLDSCVRAMDAMDVRVVKNSSTAQRPVLAHPVKRRKKPTHQIAMAL